MAEQTTAELIVENRKWVRLHQSNKYQAEAARRMSLVMDALEAAEQEKAEAWRVASEQTRLERDRAEAAERRAEERVGGRALSKVRAERDTAIKRAEDAEREMHARELHHFEEEERAAGLAAVVEKLREYVTAVGGLLDVRAILASAPADALREVKAAAWDEGFDAGYDDLAWDRPHPNPYRKEQP